MDPDAVTVSDLAEIVREVLAETEATTVEPTDAVPTADPQARRSRAPIKLNLSAAARARAGRILQAFDTLTRLSRKEVAGLKKRGQDPLDFAERKSAAVRRVGSK